MPTPHRALKRRPISHAALLTVGAWTAGPAWAQAEPPAIQTVEVTAGEPVTVTFP